MCAVPRCLGAGRRGRPVVRHQGWKMNSGRIGSRETRRLRKDLPVDQPPLILSGVSSPEIPNFQEDIPGLIADIYGIAKGAELDLPWPIADWKTYSKAATAIAGLFVDKSEHASRWDPVLSVDSIRNETGLSGEDVTEGLQELRNLVEEAGGGIAALPELFVEFDEQFKKWYASIDALRVATGFTNDPLFPGDPQQIAKRYGWEPRRLNPALTYLRNRGLIDSDQISTMGPWVAVNLRKTDATIRFAKHKHGPTLPDKFRLTPGNRLACARGSGRRRWLL